MTHDLMWCGAAHENTRREFRVQAKSAADYCRTRLNEGVLYASRFPEDADTILHIARDARRYAELAIEMEGYAALMDAGASVQCLAAFRAGMAEARA